MVGVLIAGGDAFFFDERVFVSVLSTWKLPAFLRIIIYTKLFR